MKIKLLLFLINLLSFSALILAEDSEDCQIYYSLFNDLFDENVDKSCCILYTENYMGLSTPTTECENDHILKINIKYAGIKEIPNDIYKLKYLKELNMYNNDITTIPSSVGDVSELEIINLSYNNIKEIPKEISNLKNLSELYLNLNEITSIPISIGELSKLKILDLNSNKIDTIPSEIGKLSELENLDLRYNKIQKIPDELFKLTKLKE
eukprot:jgi/Orpsp1_1/1185423/evm.model.c7180000093683.1